MESFHKNIRKAGSGSTGETDNTLLRSTEPAFLENQEKYKLLFDNIPLGIGIADSDGRLIDFNDAILKPGRYRREDMEQISSISELYYFPEERTRILSMAQKQGFVDRVEVKFKRKDGTPYDAMLSLRPVKIDRKDCWQSIVEDVSAQRAAENAARESQRRWQDIFDSAVVGIYQVTGEGCFVLVNPKLAQLFGYGSPEEFLNSVPSIYQLYDHPEDRPPILQEVNAEGFIDGAIARFRRKDGQIIWIRISARVIKNKSEAVVYEGFMTDITESRRAEERLKRSEKRYRELYGASRDGYAMMDMNGHIIETNDTFLGMLGYDEEELKERQYSDITPARWHAVEKEIITEQVLEQGYSEIYEKEYIRKDGTVFPAELRTHLFKDEKGEPAGMWAFIRDVTGRKQHDQDLRESERKYRTVLEANPDPVVFYDNEGRVIYFNPAFSRVFGWPLEERVGKKMDLFVPDDTWPETRMMIQKVMAGEAFTGLETKRFNSLGEIISVGISGAIYKDHHGNIVGSVITLRDIRDQKRLEAQFHRSQKMESVGTLAGGIAHDFNNLLMGIQGRTSLMRMGAETTHPDYEHLKGIEEYVRSATELTRQLLGFARGGRYEVIPTSLNEIVRQSAEMFGRTKKEINIYPKYQQDVWVVEVDQGQIDQVLLNLYVNAWQAMPDGGDLYLQTENVFLSGFQTKPYGLEAGKYVKISVADTGVGIDEAILDRVFDPFFTTKEMGRGTGLGLASVYGIVKSHRGIINVSSKKDQGTNFNVFLPVSEKKVRKERRYMEGITRGSETVLLVDDEEMIIEVGTLMLENLGYRVMIAGSGQEAIDLYRENRDGIHIVVLDMIMPVISGGETYEKLKEINEDVKVLLSSGYSMDDHAVEILRRGCNGFMQKPFNMKRLSQKIREILES
jgi:two-component system, cell cycle sensor histidine kinase and response regulator CckA